MLDGNHTWWCSETMDAGGPTGDFMPERPILYHLTHFLYPSGGHLYLLVSGGFEVS